MRVSTQGRKAKRGDGLRERRDSFVNALAGLCPRRWESREGGAGTGEGAARLRAMRLRQGWTQEQVAARVGVVRTTAAHWERGERLPSAEQTQALCYALGAHEEELLALTTGRFAGTPGPEPATWEEEEARLRE